METNEFNQEIPEIKEILQNERTRDYISNTLISVLEELEVGKSAEIVEQILDIAENSASKENYELNAHRLLENEGVTSSIPSKLSGRAELIYNQIKDYVEGNSVVDIGCGDGKVGEILSKQGLEVTLADIYEHNHIDSTGLKFIQMDKGIVESDEKYDNTLVLTVLHHSENPMQTLEEAKRLTKKGGRILVIESVYGIDDNSTEFGKLSHEEQRLTNVFFDHFYNRVIHYSNDPANKVSVPFNFQTPEQWKKTFEEKGLRQEKVECLGIDQKTVPEYHTLHVLRVE